MFYQPLSILECAPDSHRIVIGCSDDAAAIWTEIDACHSARMPAEEANHCCGFDIPEPSQAVARRCHQSPAVRAKGCAIDCLIMAEHGEAIAALGIPQSSRPIYGDGHNAAAIWAKRGPPNSALVTLQNCDLLSRLRFQRRAVPSCDAVMMRNPSGLKPPL